MIVKSRSRKRRPYLPKRRDHATQQSWVFRQEMSSGSWQAMVEVPLDG